MGFKRDRSDIEPQAVDFISSGLDRRVFHPIYLNLTGHREMGRLIA